MHKELIGQYIATANEKIGSAKLLLEHGKYGDAASRAYYAVFHCVQALLSLLDIKAESHSAARDLFGLHFIKTGEMDKKFARYLKELKDDRESGDYGIISYIDEDDAREAIKEAVEFIAETKVYLKGNIG